MEYPFWEKAFLGEDSWKWFAALIMTVLVPLLLLVGLVAVVCRCCSDQDKNKVEVQPEDGKGDKERARQDNQVKFSEYSDDEQQESERNKGEQLESMDQISDLIPATQQESIMHPGDNSRGDLTAANDQTRTKEIASPRSIQRDQYEPSVN